MLAAITRTQRPDEPGRTTTEPTSHTPVRVHKPLKRAQAAPEALPTPTPLSQSPTLPHRQEPTTTIPQLEPHLQLTTAMSTQTQSSARKFDSETEFNSDSTSGSSYDEYIDSGSEYSYVWHSGYTSDNEGDDGEAVANKSGSIDLDAQVHRFECMSPVDWAAFSSRKK
ncbi:hypothetical protein BDZ91DRAFT_47757 [Kalaharituber pfeilii]|nr:hypothetical protein BDZ91DRAFT_47757 [Kalaharituber pfeilii]